MASIKTLKSLDISSVTIMVTAISIVFAIIFSIILLIAFGIISSAYVGIMAVIVPTVICGTIIVSIYHTFIESFLYNLIAKKTAIVFAFEEDGSISKISTTSTAIICAIIVTVLLIIEYLVGIVLIPLLLSSAVQTLMLSGQSQMAFTLYQMIMMISNPTFSIGIIVGAFIGTFIYILIGTYVYNYIAGKGYPIEVRIKDNNTLESIDIKSFATAIAIISAVLGLISGLLSLASGGNILSIIISVIVEFILGFIIATIIGLLYNKLGPNVGKIKFELIDE
ncbi:MAG: hypothetical protein Q4P18_00455 [Methanobrevibacter sp.]|uniref:hypothetical protein n=1 Tax=Methanobrevibacter sp. TaxID=66852 RepID=UPI0026DF6140|nr:hypothetical protein [Methanobrevibacter sp.]MDO5847993.1 hypothetical protein [Methanobrevibacter sp.]